MKRSFRHFNTFATLVLIGLLLAVLADFGFNRRPFGQKTLASGPVPVCITILPGDYFSLVDHRVIVANPIQMKDIIASINSATRYFPKHPQVAWQCSMIISYSSGNSYYWVTKTTGQGTIIYCEASLRGFIIETLRSDTLGSVLEKVTKP